MLHTAAALHVHFYVVFNHLKIGTLQDGQQQGPLRDVQTTRVPGQQIGPKTL